MIDPSVAEKIRKLLGLATSSNEHEAKAAAEKACELLVRHNLRLQDVASKNDYQRRPLYDRPKRPMQDKLIFVLLQRHFFVLTMTVFNSGFVSVYFIGEDTNVEIAVDVHAFLHRAFPALWNGYRRKARCPRKRQKAYYTGLYQGLDYQLAARKKAVEHETGLMVSPDPNLPAAMKEMFPRSKEKKATIRGRRSQAWNAGVRDGVALKIRSAINQRSEFEEVRLLP